MTSSEPRNMVTLNSENLIRNHGDALEYCLQELNREDPDYQAAQVFATLTVFTPVGPQSLEIQFK
jgi:hypothetical protein